MTIHDAILKALDEGHDLTMGELLTRLHGDLGDAAPHQTGSIMEGCLAPVRTALRQLEQAGLVESHREGGHRRLRAAPTSRKAYDPTTEPTSQQHDLTLLGYVGDAVRGAGFVMGDHDVLRLLRAMATAEEAVVEVLARLRNARNAKVHCADEARDQVSGPTLAP